MNSMTGMGRGRARFGSSYLQVEIKSVNHRYCEVNARLPSRFQALEILIVQLIKKKIKRGKVDVWLSEDKSSGGGLSFSKKSLNNYYRFLREIKKELKLSEPITLSHIQSGISSWMTRENETKKYAPVIGKLVDKALMDLIRMRTREGVNLRKNIESRINILISLQKKVEQKKGQVLAGAKERIEKRIQRLLDNVEVDPAKLASEVAYYADRSDITEELERLKSHFKQMKKLLSGSKACGRPLDFLIQEINREWNTIASKTQNAPVSHWVVQAKSEMEKIREQIQNIE